LFLKLVSGAIRTIAISASAMVGGALVCFRSGTMILQWGEASFTRIIVGRFLAYQMPGCQGDVIFGIFKGWLALTTSFLAYQMP
jgi:hypothetical protein